GGGLLRRRELRLRGGIGDRAQRIDHLRAPGVVLQRLQRAPRLVRRQRVGLRGGGSGRRAGCLGESGKRKQRGGNQDRGKEFLRHEDLISDRCARANRPDSAPALRLPGRPLLRDRVSEICQSDGNVLAIGSWQEGLGNWSW